MSTRARAGIAIGTLCGIAVCSLLFYRVIRRRGRLVSLLPHADQALPQELDPGLNQPAIGELAGEKSPRELDQATADDADVHSVLKLDKTELAEVPRYSEIYPACKEPNSSSADNAVRETSAISDGELHSKQPHELEATLAPSGKKGAQKTDENISKNAGLSEDAC